MQLLPENLNFANWAREILLGILNPKRSTCEILESSKDRKRPLLSIPRVTLAHYWPAAVQETEISEFPYKHGVVRRETFQVRERGRCGSAGAKEVAEKYAPPAHPRHNARSISAILQWNGKPSAFPI